jgi:catechol 2,3-dioxygenase-like lactoylglutathione lyase family enzyme
LLTAFAPFAPGLVYEFLHRSVFPAATRSFCETGKRAVPGRHACPNLCGMRLAHLGLTVTDQERSRRFYETHFGFNAGPARSYPDGTLIIHDADGFALALHPGPAAPDDDFLHFGYVCTDPQEVRAVRARLLAAGVALAEDEDTDTYVGIKALDPDGYRVEISWDR